MRTLNLLILIVAIAGIVMSVRIFPKHQRLQEKYRQLSKVVAEFDSEDGQIAAISLTTNEEMHFAWRVSLPEGDQFITQSELVTGSWGSMQTQSGESTFRVRLRREKENMRVFVKSAGSSTSGIGPKRFADFIEQRWGEFLIETVPEGQQANSDSDEILTLLKVTVPERLLDQLADASGRPIERLASQPLILVRVGTPAAFEREKKSK